MTHLKIPKDSREFIELLNSAGVEYVVVGGHAVGYHGYPRYTGDIDFLVRPTRENAARLVKVLATFGFGDAGNLADTLVAHDHVIQLGVPPNRIDLLTSISGVDFEEASRGAQTATLDGLPVRLIGLQALLKNKRASGRAKDLADVEELERTKGPADPVD